MLQDVKMHAPVLLFQLNVVDARLGHGANAVLEVTA